MSDNNDEPTQQLDAVDYYAVLNVPTDVRVPLSAMR
jgi:hypothetical protein